MKTLESKIISVITVVIFILTSFFVLYVYENPEIYVTRLPAIALIFIVAMILNPIAILKIAKANEIYEKHEIVLRIISKILIIITSNYLIVLLFTTKGHALDVASIISIFNCLFLVILFIKNKTLTIKDVMLEHWIITSVFIGLLFFIR